PTWSPDGKSLAFKRTVTDAGQKSTSTIVKRIDSRTETKGAQQPADASYWLPDGGVASIKGAEIYRDTPEGTSQLVVNLGLMPHDIALAPGGKMLYALLINQNVVFVSSTIFAYDIATGQRKHAFSLPAGKAGANDILQSGHYLSVSPDGSNLAVVRWSDERQ